MKQFLLLLLLLSSCRGAFAITTQGSYRWRNDDGGEASATWKAPENTPITIDSVSQILRLRIEQYTSPTLGGGFGEDLEFSTDNANFTTISDDTSNAFYYLNTMQVADGDPTTDQLITDPGAAAATFVPGQVISSPQFITFFSLNAGEQTEMEYVFRPGASVVSNTTYFFRQITAASAPATAAATTATALPIWLLSFTARLEENGVRLRWETSAEHNNDRFEVMKSDDGLRWRAIATRRGAGNTDHRTTYEARDAEPDGVAFYRLDQYDEGGAVARSAVQSVQSKTRLPEVTVSPNPMTGTQLNLHVPISAEADVAAVLTDVTGAVVYRTNIHTEPGRLDYILTLPRQPAPGVYSLQLEAQGLSRAIPILVK